MFWVVVFLAFVATTPLFFASGSAEDVSSRARSADAVREMFGHAWGAYMAHAYPRDELRPLSCCGADSWSGGGLTLVDALDALAVFGRTDDFGAAVARAVDEIGPALLRRDRNVSVFETNIRVVGGLLSAHMLARARPELGAALRPGDGAALLALAARVGERLLPAFATATGVPYGTVNLARGVPPGETDVTSVAGATSFLLEFTALSRLTGDARFESAARGAARAVWARRSAVNLVGNHINASSGAWVSRDAMIGSAVDSFYEYLLKAAILFDDDEWMDMFTTAYAAVESAMRLREGWYFNVDMHTRQLTSMHFDSLQAFWPGLQVLVGDVDAAAATARCYVELWDEYGGLPEAFNLFDRSLLPQRRSYPLRPELFESLYYLSRAPGGQRYLDALERMRLDLEDLRVECGFAGIRDVESGELEDLMNSFFLAETLKYLLLAFDNTNPYADGPYLLTTEAHVFPFLPEFRRPSGLIDVQGEKDDDRGDSARAVQYQCRAPVPAALRLVRMIRRDVVATAAAAAAAPAIALEEDDGFADQPMCPAIDHGSNGQA